MTQKIEEALATLKDYGIEGPFDYGVVLGTGLGRADCRFSERQCLRPFRTRRCRDDRQRSHIRDARPRALLRIW